MAVVYVGAVRIEGVKGTVEYNRNQVVMKQTFRGKTHSKVVSVEETVLLTLDKQVYPLIVQAIKAEVESKSSNDLP